MANRETTEIVRERNRPDWLAVFLGTTCNFAMMGIFSIIGAAFRLLRLTPQDDIAIIVCKMLFLLFCVSVSAYVSGLVTGYTTSVKSRIVGAMNSLLMVELTVLVFFAVAWFGFTPIPGVVFSSQGLREAPEALIWWVMMITIPNFFAAIYGAMKGVDLTRRRTALGPAIYLPTEETPPAPPEAPPAPVEREPGELGRHKRVA